MQKEMETPLLFVSQLPPGHRIEMRATETPQPERSLSSPAPQSTSSKRPVAHTPLSSSSTQALSPPDSHAATGHTRMQSATPLSVATLRPTEPASRSSQDHNKLHLMDVTSRNLSRVFISSPKKSGDQGSDGIQPRKEQGTRVPGGEMRSMDEVYSTTTQRISSQVISTSSKAPQRKRQRELQRHRQPDDALEAASQSQLTTSLTGTPRYHSDTRVESDMEISDGNDVVHTISSIKRQKMNDHTVTRGNPETLAEKHYENMRQGQPAGQNGTLGFPEKRTKTSYGYQKKRGPSRQSDYGIGVDVDIESDGNDYTPAGELLLLDFEQSKLLKEMDEVLPDLDNRSDWESDVPFLYEVLYNIETKPPTGTMSTTAFTWAPKTASKTEPITERVPNDNSMLQQIYYGSTYFPPGTEPQYVLSTLKLPMYPLDHLKNMELTFDIAKRVGNGNNMRQLIYFEQNIGHTPSEVKRVRAIKDMVVTSTETGDNKFMPMWERDLRSDENGNPLIMRLTASSVLGSALDVQGDVIAGAWKNGTSMVAWSLEDLQSSLYNSETRGLKPRFEKLDNVNGSQFIVSCALGPINAASGKHLLLGLSSKGTILMCDLRKVNKHASMVSDELVSLLEGSP
ncbi:hypothetical protein BC938DRAFT_474743, partial [Jimgerdemannia flammicorona]